jgi:hypothetical protein
VRLRLFDILFKHALKRLLEAWWHIRQPGFNLPTRPFLPQNNRLSRPTTWEKFLPISMPITAI